MSDETPSLEYLLNLLLEGNLTPEERKQIKTQIEKTSEFQKAKTINIVIKKTIAKDPPDDES
jgi:hypothetical protein